MNEFAEQAPWGLDALTRPLGARAFLERHWPRELFVGHGPLERFGGLADIEGLSHIEALLAATRGPVRVWPPPERSREPAVVVASDHALRLYRDGWTVYLNPAERSVPQLLPFIRRLEADLGLYRGDIATEVFASKAGAGARPHCDFDFGFNVQLQGRKRWRLAPNMTVSNPHASVIISDPFDADVAAYSVGEVPREMPTEGACELLAEPGSVVFIPRGYWHTTMAQEPSLALTFACKGKMWSQLLTLELESRLRLHEKWREFPAPLNGVSADVVTHNTAALEPLLLHLRQLVEQLCASELVDRWHRPALPLYRVPARTKLELVTHPVSGAEGTFVSIEPEGSARRLLRILPEHLPIVTAVVSSNFPIAAPDLAELVSCSLTDAVLAIEALSSEGILESM
jgi:50S ribosomal protein L16 3-hydroxylase